MACNVLTWPSPCACVPGVAGVSLMGMRELVVSSDKTSILLGQGPTLLPSFILNYFLTPNRAAWGVKASTYKFWGGGKHSISATTKQLLSHKLSAFQVVRKRGSWNLDELRASRPHLLIPLLVRSTTAECWLESCPPATSGYLPTVSPHKGYLTRSNLDSYESIERLTPATSHP